MTAELLLPLLGHNIGGNSAENQNLNPMEELFAQLMLPDDLDVFSKVRGHKQDAASSASTLLKLRLAVGQEPGGDDVMGEHSEQLT